MRASERERDQAVRVLSEGCADGRLSTSTYEARVERALGAKSVDELRQLTADVKRVSQLRGWLSQTLGGRPRAARVDERVALEGIGSRPFVLGRGSAADFVLREETVSRRHAQIVRTTDGFMLCDLGSTNGTWLGGRRVGEVEVGAGDLIELGDVPVLLV